MSDAHASGVTEEGRERGRKGEGEREGGGGERKRDVKRIVTCHNTTYN